MDKELKVLILEDQNTDAELMERELRKEGISFSSRRVETKEDFLRELKDFAPDLILSDYKLPSFNGSSALAIAREQCPEVPFIFVSGIIGEELAIETLKEGATDYVLKERLSRLVPATSRALREAEERTARKQAEEQLKKRVKELEEFYDMAVNRELRIVELKEEIEKLKEEFKNPIMSKIIEIQHMEKKLIESRSAFFNMLRDLDYSYKELKKLFESLILSFVNALDAKSPWTKGHSERVTNYAIAIAKEMGLKEKDMEILRTAALLHDIGKIGTYEVILDKPERLSIEELALVKMHPVKGEEILSPISQLKDILPIIRSHHERIDGEGYPDGLKDNEIPLLARIIAVADSFDSMISERPYRPKLNIEDALSELKRCSGIQFDLQVVEAFSKAVLKYVLP